MLVCTGCVSMVERTGRFLDGSVFAEKKLAVHHPAQGIEIWEVQNKEELRSIIILLDQFPTLKIRGSAPNEQGEFFLTSLDYLGSNYHGWNEFRMDLFGTGNLILNETQAILSIPDGIEPIGISWGRIRRYDTRITGNDALTNLRNRYERILALREWMISLENTPQGLNLKDFEAYWKPVLFPETVSQKRRPQDWLYDDDQWTRAEDIRWNTGYTQRTFPEELWNIRNSGTMLRDWEEAIDWIYNEYRWSLMIDLLSHADNSPSA